MILINGASRGIGKFLLGKYKEKEEDVVGTFNQTQQDDTKYYTKVDVRDYSAIQKFIASLSDRLSNITLINCAGTNYNAFAHKVNISEWENVIDINLIGIFRFINIILPYMREQNYGRIINFSSVVAQKGIPGTSAYSASKAGLWGLVKSIASENATKGITINNLNLGYFNIGMIADVPQNYQEAILQQIPTHKFGDPEEIFNACEFLRNNSYVNGISIDMNAGLL